jgi:hypothetical protein
MMLPVSVSAPFVAGVEVKLDAAGAEWMNVAEAVLLASVPVDVAVASAVKPMVMLLWTMRAVEEVMTVLAAGVVWRFCVRVCCSWSRDRALASIGQLASYMMC